MWYPARVLITDPSVYSVGGCHESVTVSPAAGAADEAELEELLLEELGLLLEGLLLEAPEQEPVAPEEACITSDRLTDAESVAVELAVELAVSGDDPPPHAVNIPPTISEPAMNSVHEWTPVLFIGTPRQMTPFFECDPVRRSAPRPTDSGLDVQGIAWSRRPRNGPRLHEIATAIPATPLS